MKKVNIKVLVEHKMWEWYLYKLLQNTSPNM